MAVIIGGGTGNAISINGSVGGSGQVITSNGTDVSWSTPATGAFAAGTRLTFAQSAAPTGWTRVATDEADNRMLRVISTGVGGGVGGSASPILNNVVPAHTHSFTSGGVSVDHSHSGTTGTVSSDHVHGYTASNNSNGAANTALPRAATPNTGVFAANTGGISANHVHGFSTGGHSVDHSHSGTTDNGSSQTNWAPRYIDLLLCSKD